MWQRLTINLGRLEQEVLRKIAEIDLRDIRGEAHLIIRQELERRGVLQPATPSVESKGIQRNEGGVHVAD